MNKNKAEEELQKESVSLWKDMENRIYTMAIQHDNNFLTLVGFLIATSWIIITSDWVSHSVKSWLVWSITFFVIWLLLSNNVFGVQTNKLKNWLTSVLQISEAKTADEISSIWNKAEKSLKINKKDVVFNFIATVLQNLWIVCFIVWLFKFL